MTLRAIACAFLLAPALAGFAAAQTPAAAISAPSRGQAQVNELDEALRARLLTADDARSNWMAGQLDRGDIEAQVRHFAAARVALPGNRLYLATLAMACLEPVQPRLPECDAVDRLADWVTRDPDNGLPVLLLASRAWRHRDRDGTLAYLEQAALLPRFDDYWSAKAWAIWEVVRAMPGPVDDGARPLLVAGYALPSGYAWGDAARATCLSGQTDDATLRDACRHLGQRMFDVGTTWQARMLGVAMLARTATTPEGQADARNRRAGLETRLAACGVASDAIIEGLEANDAAVRARSLRDWEHWIEREASLGEVGACAELTAAKPGGK